MNLPPSKQWLVNGFRWYSRGLIRKNFHVFAVDVEALDGQTLPVDAPLIIYSNHPGWWDPIVGMLLCEKYFPGRTFYAPIDAIALDKYAVLGKLGFFGIELQTRQGVVDFLTQSSSILASPHGSLWLTPEGKFVDPRDLDQPFMPGLAHLASKTEGVHCIPLAIEYTFTEERQPFMLCKLGSALINTQDNTWNKEHWQSQLSQHLRSTQRDLAQKAISREWSSFTPLLRSRAQCLTIYDWMRWIACKITRKRFDPRHGDGFPSQ